MAGVEWDPQAGIHFKFCWLQGRRSCNRANDSIDDAKPQSYLLNDWKQFMTDTKRSGATGDPYDLNRFVQAQKDDYARALSEVKSGRKRSHWMWYIFPQFDGLGFSATSRHYAIKSIEEANAYLGHSVLGPRLLECIKAALAVDGRSAYDIFGYPDDMKLRSCATLFAHVSPAGSVFHQLLDKYFQGDHDNKTLQLVGASPKAKQGSRDT